MTLVGSDQNVSLSGDAFAGALGLKSDWFTTNATLGGPAVGMAATPNGAGYWLAGSNGGVAVFGNAAFLGSADGLALARPVVGMAATPDGQGYWLVASDGGIFSYGDAAFYGSTGNVRSTSRWWAWPPPPTAGATGWWPPTAASSLRRRLLLRLDGRHPLNRPVVGMAATPDGRGYWLVASDGGIFSFGDAAFYGSTGSIAAQPAGGGHGRHPRRHGLLAGGLRRRHLRLRRRRLLRVDRQHHPGRAGGGHGLAPAGQGYWLVAADGGIFSFGDAAFYGSAAG